MKKRAKIKRKVGLLVLPPLVLAALLGRGASWRPATLRVYEPEPINSRMHNVIYSLDYTPDGRTLVVNVGRLQSRPSHGGANIRYPDPSTVLQLWDVGARRLRFSREARGDERAEFAFSPGGEVIAMRSMLLGRNGGRVQVFESATGKRLWSVAPSAGIALNLRAQRRFVSSAAPFAVSADGTLTHGVAVLEIENERAQSHQTPPWSHFLQTRDLKTGALRQSVKSRHADRNALEARFTSRTLKLQVHHRENTLELFQESPTTPRLVWAKTYSGDGSSGESGRAPLLLGAMVSPDKTRIAVASATLMPSDYGYTPHRWVEMLRARDGRRVWRITSNDLPLHQSAFSPRGDLLALGNNGRIQLHDARTGKRLRVLTPTHNKPRPDVPFQFSSSRTLVFSPDGSQLAVASEDGTVTLWRIR